MKYYEIPDEATFNSVVGSLGTFRIRTLEICIRTRTYTAIGDCDRYPNCDVMLDIKDMALFQNLVNAALNVEKEDSHADS